MGFRRVWRGLNRGKSMLIEVLVCPYCGSNKEVKRDKERAGETVEETCLNSSCGDKYFSVIGKGVDLEKSKKGIDWDKYRARELDRLKGRIKKTEFINQELAALGLTHRISALDGE